jgi:hypothetical protein
MSNPAEIVPAASNVFSTGDRTSRYEPDPNGQENHRFFFTNGYGASVIMTNFSYGGSSGLWELAVIDHKGKLLYDTPVTSDVEGWLTIAGVNDLLRQISNLDAKRLPPIATANLRD